MKKIKAYGIALYINTTKTTKLLLCKSINSKSKWGFLKGIKHPLDIIPKDTARREFKEESGINIMQKNIGKYFYQENNYKDIGIYLVNGTNIEDINSFFEDDILLKKYNSDENSEVKFFDINNLPKIKNNQSKILNYILLELNNLQGNENEKSTKI
jgi:ADP-ribose pyrophosphatase YjhB (NUDIX family)